ncbi:hypothetical protein ABTY61_40310 [Kitasatospora sp. NPDC096128]|uniref:hypothetical protein n=1 Tax=Kitasatospora sp. NPDC096128 TaxID=3155547 RepID=UPI003321BBEE
MNPRKRLEAMVRTDQDSTTIWSANELREALDAYRDEILTQAGPPTQPQDTGRQTETAVICFITATAWSNKLVFMPCPTKPRRAGSPSLPRTDHPATGPVSGRPRSRQNVAATGFDAPSRELATNTRSGRRALLCHHGESPTPLRRTAMPA